MVHDGPVRIEVVARAVDVAVISVGDDGRPLIRRRSITAADREEAVALLELGFGFDDHPPHTHPRIIMCEYLRVCMGPVMFCGVLTPGIPPPYVIVQPVNGRHGSDWSRPFHAMACYQRLEIRPGHLGYPVYRYDPELDAYRRR